MYMCVCVLCIYKERGGSQNTAASSSTTHRAPPSQRFGMLDECIYLSIYMYLYVFYIESERERRLESACDKLLYYPPGATPPDIRCVQAASIHIHIYVGICMFSMHVYI